MRPKRCIFKPVKAADCFVCTSVYYYHRGTNKIIFINTITVASIEVRSIKTLDLTSNIQSKESQLFPGSNSCVQFGLVFFYCQRFEISDVNQSSADPSDVNRRHCHSVYQRNLFVILLVPRWSKNTGVQNLYFLRP